MKKVLIYVFLSFLCLMILLSCETTKEGKEEIKIEEVKLSETKTVIKLIRNPSRGYNFDGYIYIPRNATTNNATHLIVIPNNSGKKGSIVFHDKYVREAIISNSWEVRIAEGLEAPLFIPVFPRDEEAYYHALTYQAITSIGKARRIDLQLINMINDVLEYLGSTYNLADKVLMAGASASGDFVSRFTILHPEIVQAVVTSLNAGIPMAPASKYKSRSLEYPYGVSNIKAIAGKPFNLEAFQQVNILSMNGNLDEDATHYFDGKNNIYPMTKTQLLSTYGSTILKRCETTFEIFSKNTGRFQSILYDNIGHRLVVEDAITFLKQNKGEIFVPIKPSKPVVFNNNTAGGFTVDS